MENITFDNNVNLSLNATKVGMVIDIMESDKAYDFAIETILAGNYEFLSYQNVYIYNMTRHSINTLA